MFINFKPVCMKLYFTANIVVVLLAPTPAGESTYCVSVSHCSAAHASAPTHTQSRTFAQTCAARSSVLELNLSIYLDRDLDVHNGQGLLLIHIISIFSARSPLDNGHWIVHCSILRG
ncbi:hypothetical protein D917_04041 [Trichinella nativa]|uniref:Secreted protein n=1 Tax=Trichinella nativa TaxID=6335 RepID=A0A1Y3E661_9BILA|nr:hypothetical protein D917_04041 [Trichinella nativa]